MNNNETKPVERDCIYNNIGHWVPIHGNLSIFYVCSNCEKSSDLATHYCPHCGSKNLGGLYFK